MGDIFDRLTAEPTARATPGISLLPSKMEQPLELSVPPDQAGEVEARLKELVDKGIRSDVALQMVSAGAEAPTVQPQGDIFDRLSQAKEPSATRKALLGDLSLGENLKLGVERTGKALQALPDIGLHLGTGLVGAIAGVGVGLYPAIGALMEHLPGKTKEPQFTFAIAKDIIWRVMQAITWEPRTKLAQEVLEAPMKEVGEAITYPGDLARGEKVFPPWGLGKKRKLGVGEIRFAPRPELGAALDVGVQTAAVLAPVLKGGISALRASRGGPRVLPGEIALEPGPPRPPVSAEVPLNLMGEPVKPHRIEGARAPEPGPRPYQEPPKILGEVTPEQPAKAFSKAPFLQDALDRLALAEKSELVGVPERHIREVNVLRTREAKAQVQLAQDLEVSGQIMASLQKETQAGAPPKPLTWAELPKKAKAELAKTDVKKILAKILTDESGILPEHFLKNISNDLVRGTIKEYLNIFPQHVLDYLRYFRETPAKYGEPLGLFYNRGGTLGIEVQRVSRFKIWNSIASQIATIKHELGGHFFEAHIGGNKILQKEVLGRFKALGVKTDFDFLEANWDVKFYSVSKKAEKASENFASLMEELSPGETKFVLQPVLDHITQKAAAKAARAGNKELSVRFKEAKTLSEKLRGMVAFLDRETNRVITDPLARTHLDLMSAEG